ncbi:MAG TPA: hypothetical protein VHP58_03780 [Alphaproteobacteria bacterium]|nr:hypothetical protein [Alphaproteobacteria bacterium]
MLLLIAVISFLYSAVGALGVLGYWPQFRKFKNDPKAALYSPVSTWVIWTTQTTTYFLYALIVNGDKLFIGLTFVNMVANQACLGMLLYRRHQLKRLGKTVARNRRKPAIRAA